MGESTQAKTIKHRSTTEVRRMLNGDGNHYRVTDRFHHSRGRYFRVSGDSNLAKTFKSLVKNATDYKVVNIEKRGGKFKAEIEHDGKGS